MCWYGLNVSVVGGHQQSVVRVKIAPRTSGMPAARTIAFASGDPCQRSVARSAAMPSDVQHAGATPNQGAMSRNRVRWSERPTKNAWPVVQEGDSSAVRAPSNSQRPRPARAKSVAKAPVSAHVVRKDQAIARIGPCPLDDR